jgi:hypothetical protein
MQGVAELAALVVRSVVLAAGLSVEANWADRANCVSAQTVTPALRPGMQWVLALLRALGVW